jgi:hypothetical protein
VIRNSRLNRADSELKFNIEEKKMYIYAMFVNNNNKKKEKNDSKLNRKAQTKKEKKKKTNLKTLEIKR